MAKRKSILTDVPDFLTGLSPEITPAEIRAGRDQVGLTQEQLAGLIGSNTSTVHRWEAGTVPCGLPGAVKYALEYFKIRRMLLSSPVFQTLDQHMDELEQLRESLRLEDEEFRRKLSGSLTSTSAGNTRRHKPSKTSKSK